MSRSAFLHSLAAVLAGTRTAGPTWPGPLGDAAQRRVAKERAPEPARACPSPPVACR